MKFRVIMEERQQDGSIHTMERTAICQNEKAVIDFYGLDEPDIVSYTIEEIQ